MKSAIGSGQRPWDAEIVDIEALRSELTEYYFRNTHVNRSEDGWSGRISLICGKLDEYAAAHPGLSPVRLKAVQYETIAEHFTPVVFKNSPFYSEMGVKAAESNGTPWLAAGGWLFKRNCHLFRDANPAEYDQYVAAGAKGIHLAYGPYVDTDHHCFPYSNVIQKGLSEVYRRTEAELPRCASREETEFIECALRGLLAVKKISEKFAVAAQHLLGECQDARQRRFMSMMAETAREVPWRGARTFYEGLCAIWFLHEVCASIEGVGMYVVGHLDRMLGDLYRADIEADRITPDEAYDLLCRFMIYTDCKLDLAKPVDKSYNLQEMGEVVVLGGCDEAGREVCNDVTFMVLDAHHEQRMIYPKIHCRFSKNSRQDYLDAINRDFACGRNVISFLNDDCLIPAQVKAGKKLEDARRYVAGGCWEVMLDGFEHSAGANCYFNLARIMDMSIHEQPELTSTGVVCDKIDGATDFETVYRIVLGNVVRAIRQMCSIMGRNGSVWPQVNPAPFFSACLSDCLSNRQDYTAGGGRYNPHGVPLGAFANLVDSLLVIRRLCFESGRHSLAELLEAVRADWHGHEALRAEALAAPHFGDEAAESNSLARKVLDEIYDQTRDLKNERGGPFQLGLYIYREVIFWGRITKATPDGRKMGDVLTQGITPSRLHRSAEISSAINSGGAVDLSKFPANSVLTVSLPLGGANRETLGHVERAFAATGLAMLQLNCVDKQQLLDARTHPEKHQDLIVRLYGYSARFINLTAEMQDEFIARNLYGHHGAGHVPA
ncbi:MAG: hypothetical protein A3K19_07515 [Lentisphaerae bacterium RIFOXYB12_FULL_65_16]|nr:MAG: hypothetical protein A3K18_21720 [Lentisphaerae bacterium RIFOXYA12_64_32]OGV93388.1 MAG: hypothetical protein A3K19_07515 [Lentisphaerae bacterium RIFOXYB12_FULL_65_16]